VIEEIQDMSVVNRRIALRGVSEEEMKVVNQVMNRIIDNCKSDLL
jgi:hypothetical protein